MKKNNLLGVWTTCALFVVGSVAANAGIGDWKNYTDMKNVVGLASSRNAVWIGTNGGMLRFTLGDSAFRKFTNSEGLTGNDVSAIGLDSQGSVWVGEKSGAIDVYSPATNTWRYISDILRSSQSQKAINAFLPHGDSMYIASAFGVSVFSVRDFEFKDTYGSIGAFSHPSVSCLAVVNGLTFVGMPGGIAVSKQGAVNLAAPESWNSFATPASVTAMSVFRGNVYASSRTGVYVYQAGTWQAVSGITQSVSALAAADSALYMAGSASNSIVALSAAGIVSSFGTSAPATISSICIDSSGRIFAGFQNAGIGVATSAASQWAQFISNSPSTNFFPSVLVDANGVVWSASAGAGGSGSGKGFYSFDGNVWKNYNATTFPQLKMNEFFAAGLGPNNSKWFGSWGRNGGLAVVDSKETSLRSFDHGSAGFSGAGSDSTYVVMGRIAFDGAGNVWAPNYIAQSGTVLWKMGSDSQWSPVRAATRNAYSSVLGVTVDRNGTKWCMNTVGEFQPQPAHFMFYNESLSIQGLEDDGWGEVTVSDGMTSQSVTCVAEDKDGSLWIGTDLGITIINDPRFPLSQNRIVFLGAVRDQFINTIVVDPLNNKWIGTRTGVVVVSPDGSSLLQQYNVANTNGKLVDNGVLSIALDEKRGIAYFGTGKGLSSLEIPVIATVEKMSSLEVGPNPFILPDHSVVAIKGLADNATIKILTTSGLLVKEFGAQGGGTAFWDGTDANGKNVGSGIYLIVAYAENGNQVSTAKVAVVRR